MRYEELLENTNDTTLLTKLIQGDYSSAYKKYKKGHIIYRGDQKYNSTDWLIYNIDSPRKSKHNANYYTLLIDNLPSWSNYPKRSWSAMCSTSKKTTKIYSYNIDKSFVVFPKNNQKIAIASNHDIYQSFSYFTKRDTTTSEYITSLSQLPSVFELLFSVFDLPPNDDDYEGFKNNISIIENLYRKNPNDFIKHLENYNYTDVVYIKFFKLKAIKFINQVFPDFFKNMNVLLSPEKNKFSLQTIEFFNITGDHEVWMETPVLMIKENILAQINI